MTEETPTHRAPQGIILGVGIMLVFYAALWMAVRLLFPSPGARCHIAGTQAVGELRPGAACKRGSSPACICAPH